MTAFISGVSNLLVLLIIVYSVLTFVLPPYHPLRETLDRIIEPFLRPIRQVLPQTGAFDFSPLVLIILIIIISGLLTNIFR